MPIEQRIELDTLGFGIDDPELRSQIADALRDTDRFGPGFTVLRQAVSGSRQNYLLRVDDGTSDGTAIVWCRATHEVIDDAFAGRFTLAREAAVLGRLADLAIRAPRVLGRSRSGRALIQQYIGERDPADAATREVDIGGFFDELDRVHTLDPATVLPPDELLPPLTATIAVQTEVSAWMALARQLLASGRLSAIDRPALVADAPRRIELVLSEMDAVRIPDVDLDLDLVHGDAGRANYIVDHAGDVWLIDWELVHCGSRLEDYAWCELRGLEQDEAVWRRHVMARLDLMAESAIDMYRYLRMLIYFRSVVAIAARMAADPSHPFAAYLAQRFEENEALGWLSARPLRQADGRQRLSIADAAGAFTPASAPRLAAWSSWTDSINAIVQARRQQQQS
jgi:hypothetical protein